MRYFICGFSGAGKTTLVQKIQSENAFMDYSFFDTDQLIMKHYQEEKINHIISKVGWDEFRRVESMVLSDLLSLDDIWVSLGGGSINSQNLDKFLSIGNKCFWLDAPFETCYARMAKGGDRPMLKWSRAKLKELYLSRVKLFKNFIRVESYSDLLDVLS